MTRTASNRTLVTSMLLMLTVLIATVGVAGAHARTDRDSATEPMGAGALPDQDADVRELFAELTKEWPDNRSINVVFHGHSVPAGYHQTPEVKPFESYPFMVYRGLNERFPTAVVNTITTAIGGENSMQGAQRFRRDVLRHKPDLVFIDYAINDTNLTPAQVERAWRIMIKAARQQHVPVVLVTPTGTVPHDLGDPADPLSIRAELIRELGREYDLPVADVSAQWQAALDAGTPKESLLSHYYHPNEAGHDLAATEILSTIDDMRAEVS
ncbi:SGNH/GDSL hydrolase family protein [Haloactinopolyspora sp.]|uniref:SGNH/GDSL hydrolase family protein n=1 Tax=Haloactinopolyspora sp. TaxID=1966353 RepID=UPI002636434C|nr:SGNH/GDSL hydrolase family protein [Haloactinopolyspora sp.]